MSKYEIFSGPNTGKYGPEKTPFLDTSHTVKDIKMRIMKYIPVYSNMRGNIWGIHVVYYMKYSKTKKKSINNKLFTIFGFVC